MGSATVRRFALVAAVLLLAPVWYRPLAVGVTHAAHPVTVGLAPGGGAQAPAIRRHAPGGGWWLHGPREEQGRKLAVLAVLGLVSLLSLVPWATATTARSAPSSLVRRRHTISLRAPPLRLCD